MIPDQSNIHCGGVGGAERGVEKLVKLKNIMSLY